MKPTSDEHLRGTTTMSDEEEFDFAFASIYSAENLAKMLDVEVLSDEAVRQCSTIRYLNEEFELSYRRFSNMERLVLLPSIIPAARAYHYSLFLTMHEHDRAVAGLCAALNKGIPLILYLRNFDDEEQFDYFLEFERQLIEVNDDSHVVIALGNPSADHSVRIPPIPRLFVLDERWQALMMFLIKLARKIVFVKGRLSQNQKIEASMILFHNALFKTLHVEIGDLDEKFVANAEFPELHVSIRDFRANAPKIRAWLNKEDAQRGNGLRTKVAFRHYSRARLFWWATWKLLGLSGFPKYSDHSFYRWWLRRGGAFDPFQEIRSSVLDHEKALNEEGIETRAYRFLFELGPDSSAWAFEHNREQYWKRRMETTAMVLGNRKTWRAVRKYFRCTVKQPRP
jgi:hypothetical protein